MSKCISITAQGVRDAGSFFFAGDGTLEPGP